MFNSLSRVLLWLLVGTFLYFVIRSLTAKETFLGRVVVIVLLVFLLLAFILPTNGFVASIWAVLSFPLKPLGASILLLFFCHSKAKRYFRKKPDCWRDCYFAAVKRTGIRVLYDSAASNNGSSD